MIISFGLHDFLPSAVCEFVMLSGTTLRGNAILSLRKKFSSLR